MTLKMTWPPKRWILTSILSVTPVLLVLTISLMSRSSRGIRLEFVGYTNSSTAERSALFKVSNPSSVKGILVPQYFRAVNGQDWWNCAKAGTSVTVQPKETNVIAIEMPPRDGQIVFEAWLYKQKQSAIPRKLLQWWTKVVEFLPIAPESSEKLRVIAGTVLDVSPLKRSAPFDGNPDNLPTGGAGGSR